ncbi:hypothetical protein C5167_008644 [Papaver somniferum]|uniref:Uncharacterized protein n=1 Tax=Papaver somniferum TaxID=3469 RepID=A0A4Y7JY30_PAPSO|nr:hypothetical protein C5167_008644 [Papaver somniferum]
MLTNRLFPIKMHILEHHRIIVQSEASISVRRVLVSLVTDFQCPCICRQGKNCWRLFLQGVTRFMLYDPFLQSIM